MDNNEHSRRQHRHAEPLARPGRHLGDAGGQARLRRKAGQPQRQRRPAHGRDRPPAQQDLPGGHANPQQARAPSRPSSSCTSGKLGQLNVARGLCYKPRGSIGQATGEQPIPKTIDYDLWCGPAPRRPAQPRMHLHYDWHWIWDYGNGDLGNQGIHQMDVARWGLGKNELPRSVISVGGRFGYVDDGETANTQIAVFDYGNAELIFEVRGLPTKDYRGAIDRQRLPLHRRLRRLHQLLDGHRLRPRRAPSCAASRGGGDHFGNFIARRPLRPACRTSRATSTKAISRAPCATWPTSAIAWAGRRQFNGRNAVFGDDRDANETFARMRDHLQRQQRAARQDQLSDGPPAHHRPQGGTLRERQRRQPSSDARIPQGLRGPGPGLVI